MPDFDRMDALEEEREDIDKKITRLDWQIEEAEEDGDTDTAGELEIEREYWQERLDEVEEELDALKELEWQLDNAPAWAW